MDEINWEKDETNYLIFYCSARNRGPFETLGLLRLKSPKFWHPKFQVPNLGPLLRTLNLWKASVSSWSYLKDAGEGGQRLSKEEEQGDNQGAEDHPLDRELWYISTLRCMSRSRTFELTWRQPDHLLQELVWGVEEHGVGRYQVDQQQNLEKRVFFSGDYFGW